MPTLIDYALQGEASLRAKLYAQAGEFLKNRDRLLKMRDLVDLIEQKADAAGNNTVQDLAGTLRKQVDQAYNTQLTLERRVQQQLAAMQQPAQTALGALQLVGLLKDVAVQMARVSALQGAVVRLKGKTLTSADLASLGTEGARFGIGFAGLAALGIGAFLLFRRRRS